MAARESQGYLIAVIILALLVLLLALASFFGISKANEYSTRNEELEQKLKAEQSLSTAYQIKGNTLMALVGGFNKTIAEAEVEREQLRNLGNGLDPTQQTVVQDVTSDIERITELWTEDRKQQIAAKEGDAIDFTWRGQMAASSDALGEMHRQLNIKQNDMVKSSRDAQKKIDEFSQKVVELNNTLTTEREAHSNALAAANEKSRTLDDGMQQITVASQKKVAQLEDEKKEVQIEIGKKLAEISRIQEEFEKLNKKVKRYEKEVFDLPDGRIVHVSQNISMVHLNLGSDDGLRANRTFAVYDQDVTDFERDQHKATIEVTSVTGAHQAEARITMENPTNPVLRGDLILSATWDPGYRVPIALIGFFDLDYDGNSDLDRLVQMIEKNGGQVVARNDEEGNIIGEIDANTRYMVFSDEPPTNTSIEVLRAMKQLTDQGEKNLIQAINTRTLLNWMGQHGQARIDRLDSLMGNRFQERQPMDIDRMRNNDR